MVHFDNKVVLVTGSGSGIGKACAKAFSAAGAKVAVNSLSDSGKKVANTIAKTGHDTLFVQGDVSEEKDAATIIDQVIKRFGQLDVVVNAAGIVTGGSVENTGLDAWNRIMKTNVSGTYLISRFSIPHLRKTKGAIVNIASVLALKGVCDRAAYSASKGAILSLTYAMAKDHLKDGIRVNAVSPATVLTASLKERVEKSKDPDEAMATFISRHPVGRLANPEEIASVVLLLASEEVSFFNGTNIVIDGGSMTLT